MPEIQTEHMYDTSRIYSFLGPMLKLKYLDVGWLLLMLTPADKIQGLILFVDHLTSAKPNLRTTGACTTPQSQVQVSTSIQHVFQFPWYHA